MKTRLCKVGWVQGVCETSPLQVPDTWESVQPLIDLGSRYNYYLANMTCSLGVSFQCIFSPTDITDMPSLSTYFISILRP